MTQNHQAQGGRRGLPTGALAAITVLLLGAGIFFAVQLLRMNILPPLVLVVYAVVLAALTALVWVLRRSTGVEIALMVVALLFAIGSGAAGYVLGQVHSALGEVTEPVDSETLRVSVVVMEESPAQSLSDLFGCTVAYGEDNSLTDSMGAISALRKAAGGELTFQQFDSIMDAVDALLGGKADAVIMNETYLEMIDGVEGYESFTSITRVLYTIEVPLSEKVPAKDPASEAGPEGSGSAVLPEGDLIAGDGEETFVVYLSGIDTYGSISTRSRSDVNILAAVNTKTKQIQLINTPRDYYVPLPNSGGELDKLTHAGIYGVDNSVGTLEMLYGVKIDYYVRLNFSGFEDIIDTLGGIDVYSEHDFTAGGTHFLEGVNHVNGEQALAFARERHSFADGDIQRGKNQMAVINGVIQKLTSADVLYHYSEVLDDLSDCFQTNMGSDMIYSLVRRQLESMSTGWQLQTYTVSGEGAMDHTFSMPKSRLWVMIPDYSTVETAKEKVSAALGLG